MRHRGLKNAVRVRAHHPEEQRRIMTVNTDDNADLTGQLLEERYRIDRLLGQGGMGKVYEATHVSMDRRVAIKVLNQEMTQNEQALKRFNREMKVSSQIEHPNSIQVFDYGQLSDGRCFLVIEFLEGQTLSDVIDSEAPMSTDRVITIAEQILMGLGAAHEKGIVHRDLKPDNVMLISHYGKDDFVKVLDFGIAGVSDKDSSKLTITGAVLGTPYYMSPEQASGLELDQRSDLYALGVVLYEMVTGDVPFDGESMVSLLVKHVQETPSSPNQRRPGCTTPEMEALILSLLEKKPDARPQHAADVVERLRAISTASSLEADEGYGSVSTMAQTQAEGDSIHQAPEEALETKESSEKSNAHVVSKTRVSERSEKSPKSTKLLLGIAALGVLIIGAIFLSPKDTEEEQSTASKASAQTPSTETTASQPNQPTEQSESTTSAASSSGISTDRGRLDASFKQEQIPEVPASCRTNDARLLPMLVKGFETYTHYNAAKKDPSLNETSALSEFNKTRSALESIEDVGKNSAEYWTIRSLYNGPQQGASALLDKAIEQCDRWAFAISQQGRVFEANQDLNQAAVAYAAATELAPKWTPPHRRRLLVAGKQANWTTSLNALSALLTLDPQDSVAKAFVRRYGPRLEELGESHPATIAIDQTHPNWRTIGVLSPK